MCKKPTLSEDQSSTLIRVGHVQLLHHYLLQILELLLLLASPDSQGLHDGRYSIYEASDRQ